MSKVSVLIPVFNERDSVGELLNRVSAVPLEMEVIVVDDHSTDGTAEVLAGLDIDDVVVVTHPENRGKGAAVRTALGVATGDVVVIQDADLEYSPSDLPAMIEPIEQGRTKVVYGFRDLSDQEWIRRLGNQFLTLATNFLYGSRLKDMETCYKMVDIELMRSLDLQADRFDIEVEITAKLLKSRQEIMQVPVSYYPRLERKLIPWIDGPHSLWGLIKYRFFS